MTLPELDFDFGLSGNVAVVTGAGSGIGAAIARVFALKGAVVVCLDLNVQAAAATAANLKAAHAFGVDVTSSDDVATTVGAIISRFDCIDILVNCAGIVDLAAAELLARSAWQRTLDVNLTGSFLMAQTVGRHMIAAGRGRIINLASQAGSVAIEGHVAYCASKFGVIGLTKSLALEWGKHGITCNSISPTVVMTPLGRAAWDGPKGDELKARIPSGRFAEPDEIAAAAVFLASRSASMINGADLLIDGGYTVQ